MKKRMSVDPARVPAPMMDDHVLYDNGGTDLGKIGRVLRVVSIEPPVVVADGDPEPGTERRVRYIAPAVWCVTEPIGPNMKRLGLRRDPLTER